MIDGLDIVQAVHKLCVFEFIPKGLSPEHGPFEHSATAGYYAEKINEAGLDVTGEQVIEAILEASGWDREGPWPGHPHPDKVIAILKVD